MLFAPLLYWLTGKFSPWLRDTIFESTGRFQSPFMDAVCAPLVNIYLVTWAIFESLGWAVSVLKRGFDSIFNGQMFVGGMFAPDSALLRYGGFMNKFVPLTESFAMVFVLFHLWLAVVLIRWAKSLIPFWSN